MDNDLAYGLSKDKCRRKHIVKRATKIQHLWRKAPISIPEQTKKIQEAQTLLRNTSETSFRTGISKRKRSISSTIFPSAPAKHPVGSPVRAKDSIPPHFMLLNEILDEDVLPVLKNQLIRMGFDFSNYRDKNLKRPLRVLLRKSGS